MREELLQQARMAVQMSLDAGAADAAASVGRSRSVEFRWRAGKLEKVQENASRGVSLSLYVDDRYSAHSTNDVEPSRLKAFVAQAVALTRHLEPDPFRKIPDPALYEGRQDLDLDLVDSQIATLSRDDRIDWCKTLAAEASADDGVISATSAVMDAHSHSASVISNGFEGAVETTSIWYGAEVTIADGPTKRPEAWRYVGGRHLEDLPDVAGTGAEALRRALARRGAQKVDSVRTTMVVDREAASRLLGRVLGAISAGAVQQKRTFLADALNTPIASSALSLTDSPFRKRGLASRLFDGEGITAKERTIIQDGVLKMFYIDTYYGRKLGWDPTTGSSSNLVFAYGDKAEAEILAEVGEGIYVDSWLGGNANMTSGDYSFGVRGHMIRNGLKAEPISEMNIAGNYGELLKKLTYVGNDPVPWSTFRSPTLVFEDVQFSGN